MAANGQKPSRDALLVEARRRGLLDPERNSLMDEASKRGLVGQPRQVFPSVPRSTSQFGQRFDVSSVGIRPPVDPEVEGLPEIGRVDFGRFGQQQKTQAMMLLSPADAGEQAKLAQTSIAGSEIRQAEDGTWIISFPDERSETGTFEAVINKPGLSVQDANNTLATILQFIPAAKLTAIGTNLITKFGIGAIGAGVTQTALEAGQVAAGGELDRGEIAVATVLGGAGELAAPAISGLVNRSRGRALGASASELEAVAPSIREARQATEATGIPLFKAQQTGIPAVLERQSMVAQLPAGSQAAIKGLKAQNKAAGEAVEEFLGSIAPAESLETGAVRFRTAAQDSIEAVKAIRKERTSPLFEAAFKENPAVDLKPVRDEIASRFDSFPDGGEVQKSLSRLSKFLSGKKVVNPGSPILDAKGVIILPPSTTVTQPSLRQLQNAKLEIDQMISKVGENSLGRTTKRQLIEIKNLLLDQMDAASEKFRFARNRFAKESPAVTRLEESILGRVAKLDDTQLKRTGQMIFDAAETNPSILAKAKSVINDADPEAWNELLRVELERRIGSVRPNLIGTAGESVENVPGQLFRAIFGNDKQTKVLMRALSGDQRKNLAFLQTALRRASLGRPGGSQTAGRTEIIRELRGGIASAISKFFEPIKSLAEGLRGATFDRRTRALAEALFDPQWKPRMDQIRKIKIESPASARAMLQLLNDIEQSQPQEPEQTQ